MVGGCVEEGPWLPTSHPVAAPDFTLPKIGGGTVTLSALRGQVVVMEFWATWCGPCRMSTPSVEAVYRTLKGRGVTALLINVGEKEEEITRWAGTRFTAAILMDQDQDVARRYGVQGIPTLLVIDQEGRIIHRHSGYSGGLEQHLSQALEALLQPSAPQEPHG